MFLGMLEYTHPDPFCLYNVHYLEIYPISPLNNIISQANIAPVV